MHSLEKYGWLQQFMDILEDKIEHNPVVSGDCYQVDSLQNNARNNFVKKVYSILAIQMLITSFFVALSVFNTAFASFQTENQWLFWLALVAAMISLLVLVCVHKASTQPPVNVILLSIFTFSEAYMVSMICTLYTPESVLNAAVATLGATIGLTLYAAKTKSDFTDSYSLCYGFFWSFFCLSTLLIILNVFIIQSQFLHVLLAVGLGAIYSLYLIIDTQLILGGKKKELSLDNYILGATMLYVDIIQLFLNLLRILGDRR